jgi:hypothetical protein
MENHSEEPQTELFFVQELEEVVETVVCTENHSMSRKPSCFLCRNLKK